MATNAGVNFILHGNDKELQSTLSKVEAKFKTTAKLGAVAFAGFSAAIIATVKPFADFEKQITNVFTLLSKDEIGKFGNTLTETSEDAIRLGFAMGDVNKALFDNVSALGVSDKSTKAFREAQVLAIGGVTDLSVAVDGMTSVLNAYGKDITNATEVSNAFFTAQKKGKTTVGELAANVGKVAPIAKQAGIGFKTLLASMSQLTLGGLRTDEATTALKGAIIKLINPTDQARVAFKKLKAVGIDIPLGASALAGADFADVLENLSKAAKVNKDVISELFPEQRAFTAIAALGEKEIENLRGTINAINEDFKNGTGLNEAYAMQMATLNQKVKEFTGSTIILAKSIGQYLAPPLASILSKMKSLIDYFIEAPSWYKKSAALIIGLGAAFSALAVFVGTAGVAITGLIAAVGAVGGITAITAAVTAFGASVLAIAGPVGIAVVALGALWVVLDKVADHYDRVNTVIGANIKNENKLIQQWQRRIAVAEDAIAKLKEEIKVAGQSGEATEAQAKKLKGLMEARRRMNVELENAIALDKKQKDTAKTATINEKKVEETEVLKKQDSDDFAKRETAFLEHKQNLSEIERQNQEEISAIKKSKDDEELAKLAEKIENEKALKLEELEAKKVFWEQEGIAKNEIQEMTNIQTLAINEEFSKKDQAIKNKRASFDEGLYKFQKKLKDLEQSDLAATLANSAMLSKDFAKVNQGFQFGLAAMNTATAVTSALATGGPFPANLFAALKVGSAGAVQMATIASQSFAVGTDNVPYDMAANIHRGEAIIPSRENQFLQSGKLALVSANGNNFNDSNESKGMSFYLNITGGNWFGTPEEHAELLHEKFSEGIANGVMTPFPTGD